jgi:Toprim-like
MADDPVWLATAKTLKAGRRIRIECCALDKSLMVSNEERGYRAYCFRCGPRGFVAHGDFSIDQLRRRRDEFALLQEAHVRLPYDFTTEIPANEAVWLYRAGISTALAKHYRFGFSASLKRVVLPVYRDSTLVGFTARSTINAKPKYIERMSSPSSAVFFADPATALPAEDDWCEASGPDLVITEDILSAVRVGRIARRCVALLGTSANEHQLEITEGCETIALWLDPDRAGKKAAFKLGRTLSLQGYKTVTIRTGQDPKFYSNREIRRLLLST